MKKVIFATILFIGMNINSQSKLDTYKYFIVSENFDFLKRTDQYQTSSLTKFLFNKHKMQAYFNSDNLPNEAKEDRCNNLYVNVVSNSNILVTKLSLEFKNCKGETVYTSIEGKTRKKDYKAAYHEAIRNAFKDKSIQNYSFTKKLTTKVVINQKSKVKSSDIPKPTVIKPELVVKEVTKNNLTKVQKKLLDNQKIESVKESIETLYAQQNKNGFQLVDTSPKIVFMILKTSKKQLYILDKRNGIVYPNGKNWTIEYYENGVLVKKNYQIKF
jgi:hypothetical protein